MQNPLCICDLCPISIYSFYQYTRQNVAIYMLIINMLFLGSIIVLFQLLQSTPDGASTCDLEDVTWYLQNLVSSGDLANYLSDLDGNRMVVDLDGFSYDPVLPVVTYPST